MKDKETNHESSFSYALLFLSFYIPSSTYISRLWNLSDTAFTHIMTSQFLSLSRSSSLSQELEQLTSQNTTHPSHIYREGFGYLRSRNRHCWRRSSLLSVASGEAEGNIIVYNIIPNGKGFGGKAAFLLCLIICSIEVSEYQSDTHLVMT